MKFSDAIQEVRNRTNIVELISKYVRLKRAGTNYTGLCPFHNDKNPSFVVSESKQIFKCFACGKAGNVYTFLQEYEGMTFPEAVKFLASKVNVEIEDEFKQNKEFQEKRDRMYKLYKDVANAYYSILYSDEGKQGLNYFTRRNLTKETIKRFGLGFAPNGHGKVFKLMKEKGYDDKFLIESKLFGLKDTPYDFFYDRVMFPLVDSYGNVVSFQGRILEGTTQKYINTAESIIYKKSRHLFGINYAKNTKENFYILCEGNMDVITLHQAGFTNSVASWGTAFTIEQANLIKKKVSKVYLCQDTDSAGLKAIEAAAKICESAGIETYVLDLSPVKDADEFINKFGAEEFKKKLLNPIPSFMFLISILKKSYDLNNTYDYEKYINTIIDRLSHISNSLIRDKYIRDVATQEKLSLDKLIKLVDNALLGNKNKEVTDIKVDYNKATEETTNNIYAEKYFVNLIFEDLSLKDKIKSAIDISEIENEACKYIYKMYLDNNDLNQIIDSLNTCEEGLSNSVKDTLFMNDKILSDIRSINIVDSLNDTIRKIKIYNLEKDSTNDIEKIAETNQKVNDILITRYV